MPAIEHQEELSAVLYVPLLLLLGESVCVCYVPAPEGRKRNPYESSNVGRYLRRRRIRSPRRRNLPQLAEAAAAVIRERAADTTV